jgi:predicted DNA-binding transcriptional regulator YafY
MPHHPTTPNPRRAQNSRAPLYRMGKIHEALKKIYPKRDQTDRYPSAAKLSADLFDGAYSDEIIREDIRAMIRDHGSPIAYFPKKWGYCYTEEVSHFAFDEITEGEVFLLTVGGKCLGAFHGTPFNGRMKRLVRKVTQKLAEPMVADIERMESLISFHAGGFEAPIDVSLFEATCDALFDQEGLKFTYTKIDDNGEPEAPEERLVNPRHLANVDSAWYLIGDDLRRHGVRTFALTRISDLSRTGKRFVPKKKIDVEAEIKKNFGIISGMGDPVNVRLRFYGKLRGLIAERIYHTTQAMERLPDGALEFSMLVPHTPILDRWVLGFGEDVEVLEPASLVKSWSDHVEGMHARVAAARARQLASSSSSSPS